MAGDFRNNQCLNLPLSSLELHSLKILIFNFSTSYGFNTYKKLLSKTWKLFICYWHILHGTTGQSCPVCTSKILTQDKYVNIRVWNWTTIWIIGQQQIGTEHINNISQKEPKDTCGCHTIGFDIKILQLKGTSNCSQLPVNINECKEDVKTNKLLIT